MDKLSEHAIRMLEIADKPYRTENVINANLQDRHDMAQAIYDLILQVQMLKMTDRNCSEKPNNCETCRHNKLEWFSEICDGCSKAHSHYEPKTEPQTEIRKDVPVICAECDHVSIHQKYLFCELSHRTVYNAKPEWCPLPKLFIADDEPKVEPQTERSE